jgi:lysine 2,3-aminomutase
MPPEVKVTQYYQGLLNTLRKDHPLRRTVYSLDAVESVAGERIDPLGEEAHRLCSGLIHTYPDKALILSTLTCAVHCRYCTRGRLVGSNSMPWKDSDEIFEMLSSRTEIRDVLVSGGDPLMLSDADLKLLLSRLRGIEHIRTVRLGTKVPAVLPSRITPALVSLLAEYRVWLQIHFIHPDELTDEVKAGCDLLSGAGVPMVSQTVLLSGINDDADILTELFYGLLELRVKPYYLFQCDPVVGSSSFRTPVQRGLDLMKELQGRVSGLALPNFCIDAPGGGGKITLQPDTVLRRDGRDILLTGYNGKEYRYPDLG